MSPNFEPKLFYNVESSYEYLKSSKKFRNEIFSNLIRQGNTKLHYQGELLLNCDLFSLFSPYIPSEYCVTSSFFLLVNFHYFPVPI